MHKDDCFECRNYVVFDASKYIERQYLIAQDLFVPGERVIRQGVAVQLVEIVRKVIHCALGVKLGVV